MPESDQESFPTTGFEILSNEQLDSLGKAAELGWTKPGVGERVDQEWSRRETKKAAEDTLGIENTDAMDRRQRAAMSLYAGRPTPDERGLQIIKASMTPEGEKARRLDLLDKAFSLNQNNGKNDQSIDAASDDSSDPVDNVGNKEGSAWEEIVGPKTLEKIYARSGR